MVMNTDVAPVFPYLIPPQLTTRENVVCLPYYPTTTFPSGDQLRNSYFKDCGWSCETFDGASKIQKTRLYNNSESHGYLKFGLGREKL